MKEIGIGDLAFTLQETSELLHRHEVGLSDADLQVLHRRTDGWAAGDGEQVIELARSHGLAAVLSGRARRHHPG